MIVALSGLLLALDSFRITGFAVYNGDSAGSSIFGFIGLILFVGEVFMMTAAKSELEKSVEVYDNSKGKSKETGRFYTMIDKYGKRLSLGEFKEMIDGFRKEKDGEGLIEMAKQEYAELLTIAEDKDDEKSRVAKSFLEVLGINTEKEEDYRLKKEERRELIEAFRSWSGEPNARQREVMKKYNLHYQSKSGKHPKIVYIGTGYSHAVPWSSGDSIRGAKNMAHDFMALIERARKDLKEQSMEK